jgi:2-dehydro-3-deoxyphosphogluconate aldolase / (4S)-4-hydroxy-2-oxoglutarate aldolase
MDDMVAATDNSLNRPGSVKTPEWGYPPSPVGPKSNGAMQPLRRESLWQSAAPFPPSVPMNRSEILARLAAAKIVAVIRAKRTDQALPLCRALVAGGVTNLEITLTTPNALQAIREVAAALGDQALVGVGTVLDPATATAAIQAGAQFVVTPIMRPDIAKAAHALDKPVMLGAYTPTEAQLAHEAGADCVKLFPAEGLGIAYIKSLRAPLPHLKIVPTGGVDLHNVADFIAAGCTAVGVGSSLISAQVLANDDWEALTKKAAEFSAKVKA